MNNGILNAGVRNISKPTFKDPVNHYGEKFQIKLNVFMLIKKRP